MSAWHWVLVIGAVIMIGTIVYLWLADRHAERKEREKLGMPPRPKRKPKYQPKRRA